jgi:ribosomal protein L16 Arg81 hydroxylase
VDFHLYGGLLPESTSFPAHNDLANNYIIQFDGQCEWVIYKEQASFEEAFNYNIIPEDRLTEERRIILNPGDIIYIPSGKYHKCIPLGKRLSLSVPIL